MNKKSIISAAIALCLAVSGSAFAAQGNKHDNNRYDHGHNEQARHGGNDRGKSVQHYRGNNKVHANNNGRYDRRGAGPRHDIYKGKYLPREYRHRHYVVNDWRGHRLSAPPRGYHWVQAGGDYALVTIGSGLVFQIHLR